MTDELNQENWLQRLPIVCHSHMHNTAGDSLHRHLHNSIKSSALFRREVEQPVAAGGAGTAVLTPLLRSYDHVYTTPAAPMTTNSLDIFVFYLYDLCFFFFFSFLRLSCFRSVIDHN